MPVSEVHDKLRASAQEAYENGEIDDAWRDDLLRRIGFMQRQEEGTE